MNVATKRFLTGTVSALGALVRPAKRPLPPTDSVRTILVASVHGLGDVFYSSVILPLLRQRFPQSVIDVWVHPRGREVLLNHPDVRRQYEYGAIVTRRGSERFVFDPRQRLAFIRELRHAHYDLAIDCSWVMGVTTILWAARPRFLAGSSQHGLGFLFDAEIPYQVIHTTPLPSLYPVILRSLGLVSAAPTEIVPLFYMSAESSSNALHALEGWDRQSSLIAIHTSAGWTAKEWGTQRYAELMGSLRARYGATCILIGSGERDRAHRDSLRNQGSSFIDAVDLPLDTVGAIFKWCTGYIGGDSFPMHLAVASGVPAIALFGPTNPQIAVSSFANIHVLYHQLWCSAPERERYCTRDAGRTCPFIECLERMGNDEVLNAVEQFLHLKVKRI